MPGLPGGACGSRRSDVITKPATPRVTGVAFAIVHFTAGFVPVLLALSVLPVTRYRLTGAYLGGVWALVPDAHHVLDGPIGEGALALHDGPRADAFFYHYTLDRPVYRARNDELAFVSLGVLGVALLVYDWRVRDGRRSP